MAQPKPLTVAGTDAPARPGSALDNSNTYLLVGIALGALFASLFVFIFVIVFFYLGIF